MLNEKIESGMVNTENHTRINNNYEKQLKKFYQKVKENQNQRHHRRHPRACKLFTKIGVLACCSLTHEPNHYGVIHHSCARNLTHSLCGTYALGHSNSVSLLEEILNNA